MSTVETGIRTWQDISEKVNEDVSRGILAVASDEIQKLIEDREKVQQDVVLLFVHVANALDV